MKVLIAALEVTWQVGERPDLPMWLGLLRVLLYRPGFYITGWFVGVEREARRTVERLSEIEQTNDTAHTYLGTSKAS